MKKLAIVTKTITVKGRKGKGFVGEYTELKEKSIVVRFIGIPVFKSVLIIE